MSRFSESQTLHSCACWLGSHETVGGVNTIKRGNIIVSIFYFYQQTFAVLVQQLQGDQRLNLYVANRYAISRHARRVANGGYIYCDC